MSIKSTSMKGSARVYEDFNPAIEQTTAADGAAEIIRITLPGFKREHVRVMLDSQRNLQASGESPLGGNRWRRFHKLFGVPEACDTNAIRAKFEKEKLQISLPMRKSPAADAAPKQPAAAPPQPTEAAEPSKPADAEPKPTNADANADPKAVAEAAAAPQRPIPRQLTIPELRAAGETSIAGTRQPSLPPAEREGSAEKAAAPTSADAAPAPPAIPALKPTAETKTSFDETKQASTATAKPDDVPAWERFFPQDTKKTDDAIKEKADEAVGKAAGAEEREMEGEKKMEQESTVREALGKEREDKSPETVVNGTTTRKEEATFQTPTVLARARPRTRVLLLNLSVSVLLLIGMIIYVLWKMQNPDARGDDNEGFSCADFIEL